MSNRPSVLRILEFHKLLDQFADIQRVVHVKRQGNLTFENDTEHSFNLAMTAWFLAQCFPELDPAKIIKLALVHDLVEIYAGDTFAFADQELIDSKADREAAAQLQLQKEWGDFADLHAAITEYEELHSPEACFVYALDKLMPMFAIYLNDGYTWHDKQLTLERLHKERMAKVAVSPEVKPYWDELYQLLLQSPHLLPS